MGESAEGPGPIVAARSARVARNMSGWSCLRPLRSSTPKFSKVCEGGDCQRQTAIGRVMTDNHLSYKRCRDVADAITTLGKHVFIRSHCPWQNGKVERYNRTLQTDWAYRRIYLSNNARTAALAPWLQFYNTERRHSALGGQPPISRLS